MALLATRAFVLSGSIDDYPEGIILPVDKPYRWTSADVIRKLKFVACRHFGKKNLKVGHAGTLDPLATGLLLVCIGKATKLAEELQRSEKEYIAAVAFGATTPSYDLEKDVDRLFPFSHIDEETIRAALPSFIGPQEQVAPLFSAKSADGVRAYELARKVYRQGGDFDHTLTDVLSRQSVVISALDLLAFLPHGLPPANYNCNLHVISTTGVSRGTTTQKPIPASLNGHETLCGDFSGTGDALPKELSELIYGTQSTEDNTRNSRINVADSWHLHLPTAVLRIRCSKGTYIRALARDIGEALGSGAHLASLRRTVSGHLHIEDSLTVSEATSLLR